MGKKNKRIINIVFNYSLVVVPIVLLAFGISFNAGAFWDLLCGGGIVAVLLLFFALHNNEAYRPAMGFFASGGAFFIVAFMVALCHLTRGQAMVAEFAIAWGMLLVFIGIVDAYIHDKPDNSYANACVFLCVSWVGFIVLACIIDITEFYFGYTMPARISNLLGLTFGLNTIGIIICGIIATIQCNVARR